MFLSAFVLVVSAGGQVNAPESLCRYSVVKDRRLKRTACRLCLFCVTVAGFLFPPYVNYYSTFFPRYQEEIVAKSGQVCVEIVTVFFVGSLHIYARFFA